MHPSKVATTHNTIPNKLRLHLFGAFFFNNSISSLPRSSTRNTTKSAGRIYAITLEMLSALVSGTTVAALLQNSPTLIAQKHVHTIFRIIISFSANQINRLSNSLYHFRPPTEHGASGFPGGFCLARAHGLRGRRVVDSRAKGAFKGPWARLSATRLLRACRVVLPLCWACCAGMLMT